MTSVFKILGLGGVLLASPLAHPISRVGNARIGDTASGFSAPIPRGFAFARETPSKNAELIAPRMSYGAGGMNNFPLLLSALDFGRTIPELAASSRQEIQKFFVSGEETTWTKISEEGFCVDVFTGHSETRDTLVAVWGSSKGVIFSAEAGLQTRWALREIFDGIELDEGACGWN
ncbi:MAG: hypothetical protein ABIR96_08380 [Bdellovibrionota bacterium]